MNKYEDLLGNFDLKIQPEEVESRTEAILSHAGDNYSLDVLNLLYSCIDLTSLGTEDSNESIWKWVEAINDLESSHGNSVAAVCVYPNLVATVRETLRANVKVASVAGGFPSSQTFQEVKIAEVSLAVAEGADEIDIVINCGDLLDNNLKDVVDEIEELKHAARQTCLKVILETGLLRTPTLIQTAAALAMHAGADFVKTSTGKVYPGASPEAVYLMCQVAKTFYKLNKRRVGIKVSGGVRTAAEAVQYYTLVKSILGEEWLTPKLFRIGASSLAGNLLEEIDKLSEMPD
jgi:deoxyribose-phosphate aldolase